MKKYNTIFVVILICVAFLSACGSGKVIYGEGFPTEDSPAFMEFMRHFIFKNRGEFLIKVGETNIYAELNSNTEPKKLNYFTYTDSELKKQYETLLKSSSPKERFNGMALGSEATKALIHPPGDEMRGILPEITVRAENILEIITFEGKRDFDLTSVLKDFNVRSTDDLIVNIAAVNPKSFQLNIDVMSSEGFADKT